jgi:hypothetical protein
VEQVRIDGIFGLDPTPQPRDGKSGKPDKAAKSGESSQAKPAAPGPRVEPAQQSLVRQALTAPEVDLQAVEEARSLLQSGQLDTPAAVQRAARNLLDIGL